MRSSGFAVLVSVLLASASGCLYWDDGDPGCWEDDCGMLPGDIGFYWAFGMPGGGSTDSCLQVDVAWIDVRVYDAYGERIEFEVTGRPCTDQGAWLTDFWPGDYELEIQATCARGGLGYEGWYDLTVFEGSNDFGVLVLDPVGGCT